MGRGFNDIYLVVYWRHTTNCDSCATLETSPNNNRARTRGLLYFETHFQEDSIKKLNPDQTEGSTVMLILCTNVTLFSFFSPHPLTSSFLSRLISILLTCCWFPITLYPANCCHVREFKFMVTWLMRAMFFCRCDLLSRQREIIIPFNMDLCFGWTLPLWVNHSVEANLQFSHSIETAYLEVKAEVSSPGRWIIIHTSTKKRRRY